MPVNDASYRGWPFVNHAMEVRGTQTPSGPQRESMVLPRYKYTFLVELQINPSVLIPETMNTNLLQYLHNGRLYATMKSIELPKVNYEMETLRSYNKYVKVPTKREFEPVTMVFHDDISSLALALWKEYDAFYSYAGDVGRGVAISGNPATNENNQFRVGNSLVGEQVRTNTTTRPSVGMTLRPNQMRHFFDSIVIYDLGSDPDSVNTYYLVHPVVTQWAPDNRDYFDRTSLSEMSFTLEYENYYFTLGQNNVRLHQIIEYIMGFSPQAPSIPAEGHAEMTVPDQGSNLGRPVDTISGTLQDGSSLIENLTGFTTGNPLGDFIGTDLGFGPIDEDTINWNDTGFSTGNPLGDTINTTGGFNPNAQQPSGLAALGRDLTLPDTIEGTQNALDTVDSVVGTVTDVNDGLGGLFGNHEQPENENKRHLIPENQRGRIVREAHIRREVLKEHLNNQRKALNQRDPVTSGRLSVASQDSLNRTVDHYGANRKVPESSIPNDRNAKKNNKLREQLQRQQSFLSTTQNKLESVQRELVQANRQGVGKDQIDTLEIKAENLQRQIERSQDVIDSLEQALL